VTNFPKNPNTNHQCGEFAQCSTIERLQIKKNMTKF
jgi:hypothetical protein